MNYEQQVAGQSDIYVFSLYIAGVTPCSQRAIVNVKHLCEEKLKGRYTLQIIDIYQQPELAKREHIVVVPTLIKKLPIPLQILIGDLSDKERVLVGLHLKPN